MSSDSRDPDRTLRSLVVERAEQAAHELSPVIAQKLLQKFSAVDSEVITRMTSLGTRTRAAVERKATRTTGTGTTMRTSSPPSTSELAAELREARAANERLRTRLAKLEFDGNPNAATVSREESKVISQLRARVAELEGTVAHFQAARQSQRQQQLHRSRALLTTLHSYPAI